MPITFRPGVKPNDPSKPRLKLAPFRTAAPTAAAAPPKVDYISQISYWPMYLNDAEGDCTIASKGHQIQVFTTFGRGQEFRVTDSDVQRGYIDVSGYNPATGANDNGAVIQETMGYWRTTGVGGHKILAFAEVNIHDRNEVNAALATFGSVEIGFDFPKSAMAQFNNGEAWSPVAGSPIEGGHDVCVEGYNSATGNLRVITWGAVQEMTPAFWDKYVTEAWVVITDDWLDAQGRSPEGIDLYGLGEAFAAMTGKPNPFPKPQPAPVPAPIPEPVPAPDPIPAPVVPPVGDPDARLLPLAKKWASSRHTGQNKEFAKAIKAWIEAKSGR